MQRTNNSLSALVTRCSRYCFHALTLPPLSFLSGCLCGVVTVRGSAVCTKVWQRGDLRAHFRPSARGRHHPVREGRLMVAGIVVHCVHRASPQQGQEQRLPGLLQTDAESETSAVLHALHR